MLLISEYILSEMAFWLQINNILTKHLLVTMVTLSKNIRRNRFSFHNHPNEHFGLSGSSLLAWTDWPHLIPLLWFCIMLLDSRWRLRFGHLKHSRWRLLTHLRQRKAQRMVRRLERIILKITVPNMAWEQEVLRRGCKAEVILQMSGLMICRAPGAAMVLDVMMHRTHST